MNTVSLTTPTPTPKIFTVDKFNRIERIKLHTHCLFKNPQNWKFYCRGIIREIFKTK
jgi:hypothetical protein